MPSFMRAKPEAISAPLLRHCRGALYHPQRASVPAIPGRDLIGCDRWGLCKWWRVGRSVKSLETVPQQVRVVTQPTQRKDDICAQLPPPQGGSNRAHKGGVSCGHQFDQDGVFVVVQHHALHGVPWHGARIVVPQVGNAGFIDGQSGFSQAVRIQGCVAQASCNAESTERAQPEESRNPWRFCHPREIDRGGKAGRHQQHKGHLKYQGPSATVEHDGTWRHMQRLLAAGLRVPAHGAARKHNPGRRSRSAQREGGGMEHPRNADGDAVRRRSLLHRRAGQSGRSAPAP